MPAKAEANSIKRNTYVALAVFFVALGAVGIVVPVLPTTPFLLLASFFSAKSSPRIHRYIVESRLFGPTVRDWQQHRGIRLRTKVQAIVLVLVGLGIMVISAAEYPIWIVTGLLLGAVGMTVILRLPTI